ncbi:MAG: hypothetical protein Fur009_4990 [Candidatus Microgenomates bacterium]
MRLIKKIIKNKYFFLFFIFGLTFFLRVYNLPKYISFHQDQVRDLFYIKEHIDKKTPILLGPKASVGDFYLPPFWYYLMAISYFFSPSPLSPAIMVAFLNSLAVIFIYLFADKFLDKKTAFFSSLLYAVSPISIEYSRFAWNPNPIPFFTILTFYFLYLYLEKNNIFYFIFGSIFANLTLQLHYQGFIIFSFYFFIILLLKKINLRKFFIYIFLNFLLILPFFIYEYQNNFSNTLGIINFVLKNQNHPLKFFGIPFFIKFLFSDFSLFLGKVVAFKNKILGLVFFGLLILFIIKNLKSKDKKIRILNYFMIYSFFLFFIYKNSLIDFYLLFFIPPFIIYLIYNLFKIIPKNIAAGFLMFLFILNIIKSPVFGTFDNTYLWLTKSVNEVVKNNNYCVFYDIFPETFIENKLKYLFSLEKNKEENNCSLLLENKKPKNIKVIYYFCEPAKCQPDKFKILDFEPIKFKQLDSDVKIYKYNLNL